jgi:deaminated glutathione amidase
VELAVAALQLNSQGSVEKNLEDVARLIRVARARGAALVVLPENFALMGEQEADRLTIAEGLDGPITTQLRDIARAECVALVLGGYPHKSPEPARPFNTSVYIDAQGAIRGVYHKIHMFDVSLADGTEYRESASSTAGSEAVLVRDGGLQLGMTICYDVRFPELFRSLTHAGANVISVPAAFTLTTGKDHWHTLLRARAIENQVFVVAAAQHGKHPRGRQTYGKALIVDPWGDVLAQAPEGEGMALAILDFDAQSKVRKSLPCLLHRRAFAGP